MIRKLARPAFLSVAGIGSLTGAVWSLNMLIGWAATVPLGLAATGVALLLLEWRFDA